MAIDKAVDSTSLNSGLTSIANAIRTKGGTQEQLAFPAGFVTAIENLPSASSAISIVDTIDPVSGGTIRTITGHVGTYETWTITYRDGTSEDKIVMVEEDENDS